MNDQSSINNDSFENEDISKNLTRDVVIKKINGIFNDSSFVYRANCIVNINGNIYSKIIVGHGDDYLLTLDGEKILIKDINNIELSA